MTSGDEFQRGALYGRRRPVSPGGDRPETSGVVCRRSPAIPLQDTAAGGGKKSATRTWRPAGGPHSPGRPATDKKPAALADKDVAIPEMPLLFANVKIWRFYGRHHNHSFISEAAFQRASAGRSSHPKNGAQVSLNKNDALTAPPKRKMAQKVKQKKGQRQMCAIINMQLRSEPRRWGTRRQCNTGGRVNANHPDGGGRGG